MFFALSYLTVGVFFLAGAIVSILVNPLIFALLERAPKVAPQAKAVLVQSTLSGHDVLIGYGRVGRGDWILV